jgi:hypothetical protein
VHVRDVRGRATPHDAAIGERVVGCFASRSMGRPEGGVGSPCSTLGGIGVCSACGYCVGATEVADASGRSVPQSAIHQRQR